MGVIQVFLLFFGTYLTVGAKEWIVPSFTLKYELILSCRNVTRQGKCYFMQAILQKLKNKGSNG